MKVSFLSHFIKDLDSITDPKVKADIKANIEQVKTAPSRKAILNLKKLQGYKNRLLHLDWQPPHRRIH
jgi:hypothetical protein